MISNRAEKGVNMAEQKNAGPSFTEFATVKTGNFVKAANYKIGSKITAKVVKYLGLNTYTNPETNVGTTSPIYAVQVNGTTAAGEKQVNVEMTYRLNQTNAAILAEEYDVVDYPDIVNKTLTLQVGQTQKGNSFTVTNVA